MDKMLIKAGADKPKKAHIVILAETRAKIIELCNYTKLPQYTIVKQAIDYYLHNITTETPITTNTTKTKDGE